MVVHKVKYFPLMKGTYGTHNRTKLTSYLNAKFAEPGHMRFFLIRVLSKLLKLQWPHKRHPDL